MIVDVMAGYQQTEVGIIPEDWELVQLGRLIHSVEYGSSAKSKETGAVPVLRMGNLQGGRIDWSDLVYTSDESEIKRYSLNFGDVLFNRTNTIDLVGKSARYEGEQPAIFAGYLIRVNTNKALLDTRYLNHVLNTEFSRKHSLKVLSVAVGQANINGQKLKTYPIPLPPTLTEQQAIAEALGDADASIKSLEQFIAKKRQIKQGAMQELLTGKRRLPGFEVQPGHKTTEIGVIPEDWDTCPLGQVGKWLSGGTPSMSNLAYWDGDIPWISAKDMKVSWLYDSQDHITRKAVTEGARLVPPGTVLMVIRGMILAHTFPVARAECPLAFNQDLKAVIAAEQIDSTYLLFWLMGNAPFFLGLTTESTHGTKRLPPEVLFRVPFPLPTNVEQAAIATVLSDMDAEITALENRLAKARDIKQGMMQELLTGRVRLV